MRPARSSGPIAGTQEPSFISEVRMPNRGGGVFSRGGPSERQTWQDRTKVPLGFCWFERRSLRCPAPATTLSEAASRKRTPPGSRAAHRACSLKDCHRPQRSLSGRFVFSDPRLCERPALGCALVNDIIQRFAGTPSLSHPPMQIIESFVCHYAALGFCKLLPGAQHPHVKC